MSNSKKEKQEREPVDPQLDAPSVANEDKHINFLEEEEKDQESSGRMNARSEADEKRKKEWQEGIEAGKRQKNEQPPFQRDTDEQEEY